MALRQGYKLFKIDSSPFWYYRLSASLERVPGKRYAPQHSTKATDRREAQRIAQAAANAARSVGAVRQDGELKELVTNWLVGVYNKRAEPWAHELERIAKTWLSRWTYLSEMTDRALSDYIDERLGQVHLRTVRKEKSALNVFLKYCKRIRLIDRLPDWDVPGDESDYESICLPAADIKRIVESLPTAGHLRQFYTLLWEYGCRRGTLERLCWSDVDIAGRRINVRSAIDKKRYKRGLAITDSALEVFQSMERGEGLVFGHHDSRKALRTAATVAGLAPDIVKRISPHVFRHSMATDFLSTSSDIASAQYVLGHLRLETTKKYLHPEQARADEALRERSKRIWAVTAQT